MKYMLMTYGNQSAWDALGFGGSGQPTWSEAEINAHFRAMGAFHEDIEESGELVAAHGLADPTHTRTVEVRDGSPVVTDGPYAEAKEFLAGFDVIDCESHDRALAIAARFSEILSARVELRPIMAEGGDV